MLPTVFNRCATLIRFVPERVLTDGVADGEGRSVRRLGPHTRKSIRVCLFQGTVCPTQRKDDLTRVLIRLHKPAWIKRAAAGLSCAPQNLNQNMSHCRHANPGHPRQLSARRGMCLKESDGRETATTVHLALNSKYREQCGVGSQACRGPDLIHRSLIRLLLLFLQVVGRVFIASTEVSLSCQIPQKSTGTRLASKPPRPRGRCGSVWGKRAC